jgi:hypothetical protein
MISETLCCGWYKIKKSFSNSFFVSTRAYEFSGIADNLPNQDIQSNTEDETW